MRIHYLACVCTTWREIFQFCKFYDTKSNEEILRIAPMSKAIEILHDSVAARTQESAFEFCGRGAVS